MNFKEAHCKDLPKEIKNLFLSFNISELKKAVPHCDFCTQKKACLKESISNSTNYGVWGGEILDRGKPLSKHTTIRRISNWR